MIKRREALRLLAGAGAAALTSQRALAALAALARQVDGQAPQPLLPLFPLGIVMLPGNNVPLHIFEPRYREMIQECLKGSLEFGILLTQGDTIEPVGCTAKVVDLLRRYRDGRFDVLVHGERCFRLGRAGELPGQSKASALTEDDFDTGRAFYRGAPLYIEDEARAVAGAENEELIAQAIALRKRLNALVAADDPDSTIPRQKLPAPAEPQLSFHLMNGLPADPEWKQQLLESRNERDRLVLVTLHLDQLIQYMENDSDNPAPRQRA
jgi:Lon protease-like protein